MRRSSPIRPTTTSPELRPIRTARSSPLSRRTSSASARELARHLERGRAGALGVVLVGDRGAEERHDAVAGVLVDGPLVAVDAVREDPEEAIEETMPFLGIDALGELHRARDVGEEDGDRLALALERALVRRGSSRRGGAACRSAARGRPPAPPGARRSRCRTSPRRDSRVRRMGRAPDPPHLILAPSASESSPGRVGLVWS